MSAHEFPNDAERCIHCGTLSSSLGQTVCPGPQHIYDNRARLRPEPARHQYASEDYDTIGARVAVLEAERRAVMNEPAKED